jgi:DNA-binding response OmpR family regulator
MAVIRLLPTAVARAPIGEPARRFRPRWPTLLVVADEATARQRLAEFLRGDGYTVHLADGYRSAMVILHDFDPSLTLIDLPSAEAARLMGALHRLDTDARMLIVGDRDAAELRRAVAELRRIDEDEPPAA